MDEFPNGRRRWKRWAVLAVLYLLFACFCYFSSLAYYVMTMKGR